MGGCREVYWLQVGLQPTEAVKQAEWWVQEVQGLAEWQQPNAGMFIWLKLLAGVQDVDDIAADLVKANVMVLPGALSTFTRPTPLHPTSSSALCFVACNN